MEKVMIETAAQKATVNLQSGITVRLATIADYDGIYELWNSTAQSSAERC